MLLSVLEPVAEEVAAQAGNMGNTMGKKRKMGGSLSSKRFGGPDVHAKKDGLSPLGRSYSMPLHAKPKSDNYHVVALTSSTYGILKVDATKDLDDARTPVGKSRLKEGSGIEGLEQLKDLDTAAGGISMPWSEVEEILNRMKPIKGGPTKESEKERLVTVTEEVLGEPETINMWELMEGLDDDARSPSPLYTSPLNLQPVLPAPPKKGRSLESSLSFSAVHSVTEVDAPTLKAAIHAEAAAEQAWKPPQSTENTVAGRIHAPALSSRPGSGKENAEPVKPLVRDAAAAFTLTTEKQVPVGISSKGGVSAIVNALNNRSAAGSKPQQQQQQQTDTRKALSNSVATPEAIDVAASQDPTSLGLEPQSSYTSPFSFQTTSSDDSDDHLPPGSPLFDPELLASFEKAMEEVSEDEWYAVRRSDADVASTSGSSSDGESPNGRIANGKISSVVVEASPLARNPESDANSRKMFSKVAPFEFEKKRPVAQVDPLLKFERKCPPGGEGRVVLYFTSLRGIRKTFEDCSHMKMIIKGFNVAIDERDVSIHAEFREELRELQGKMVPVPRLYIKGHYIGGAEEVSLLHEDGTLAKLLEGLPHQTSWEQCDGCGGVRFVPCSECSGSCKVITEDGEVARCTECNENGLMRCPICP